MQQLSVDTEGTTRSGTVQTQMERHPHRYLLLQLWCALLTVALLVMAAFLTSIKPKSEDSISTVTPEGVGPAGNTSPVGAALKSQGSSPSFIQLIRSHNGLVWEENPRCDSCSLALKDDSIHCLETSQYFLYAQVSFLQKPSKNESKSVTLRKNPTFGKQARKLVVGTFPKAAQGSVWVAKIVHLTKGDSISLDVTDDHLKDHTFWGAYRLG